MNAHPIYRRHKSILQWYHQHNRNNRDRLIPRPKKINMPDDSSHIDSPTDSTTKVPMIPTHNNRVWIISYNAAPPQLATMFRHICFARELMRAGYDVRIISASTIHNADINLSIGQDGFKEVDYDGIKFIHLKTKPYGSNKLKRAIEFIRFPSKIRKISKVLAPPAAVLHSAAVPFDLQTAHVVSELRAKYIVEISDLWPASFVAFGVMRPWNPVLPVAYVAEHWLYHKADELIFTMEGGVNYVKEKAWHSSKYWPVNIEKIHNINQGVDLAAYDAGTSKRLSDQDLEDKSTFKVIYVGSIRHANNLSSMLDAAEIIQQKALRRICFLVYGDGDHRIALERQARDRGISNVKFKGRISPADVPAVLAHSDANLFHFSPTPLTKYGLSPNKLFIYFASGKPVVSTLRPSFDLVERYGAGISVGGSPDEIAEGIIRVANASPSQYAAYCAAARQAAIDHDYSAMARKLIALLPPIKA